MPKKNDEYKLEMPEYETKSIPHEIARGVYAKYRNTRTGETKTVRESGSVEETKSTYGMDHRWTKL